MRRCAVLGIACLILLSGCRLPSLSIAAHRLVGAAPLSKSATGPSLLLGVHQDLTWESSASLRVSRINAAKKTLHAAASRSALMWSQIEPKRGVWSWGRTDAVVKELDAAGLTPVFFILGSPSWANGTDPSVPDATLHTPTQPAAFNAWVREFAQFAHAAALRYRGRVEHWSIWNEPNNPDFYKPTPNATLYAKLYVAARTAIHSADPHALVAAGEVNALQAAAPRGIRGVDFIRTLLRLRVPMDAVAIHPYASAEQAPGASLAHQNNFTDIALVESELAAAGRAQTPIWVTEWGWDTRDVTTSVQTKFVSQSLNLLRNRYRRVTVAIYFLDCDRFYAHTTFTFGLLQANLSAKPAAAAFKRFAESLSAG